MLKKQIIKILLVVFCLCSILPQTVWAKAYKNQWVNSSGYYYYYNEAGNKVTGLNKIDKKYYYFDSYGRQQVGWVKLKGNYYFFRISKGNKGYRVKSAEQNGITLGKNGKAVITSKNKEKLRLLTKANKIVHKKTNWTMSRTTALKTCFSYARSIRYQNIGSFKKQKNWDRYYAARFLDVANGDCYTGGCGFAYLAAALGVKNVYAISSGEHGWAEIKGRIYDPAWANVYDKYGYKFFKVDYDMSGKNGIPHYKGCRKYAIRID